jgi:hypothetical protein
LALRRDFFPFPLFSSVPFSYSLPPLTSNDLLGGPPTRVLSKADNQPIAVFDHELALPISSILWSIDDVGATRAQLVGQRVNSHYAEVNVRGIFGPARSSI